MVEYKGHDGGLTWTGVIAGWKQVVDLAGGAIYQGGIAHLQIGRQLGLGTSTVNLIVRRTFHYDRGECFKLSVVMEYINRDEWSCILEYQQRCSEMYCNDSIAEAPLGWRGNERIIEEMPKSRYQKDQKDVADVLRHIAHESMPLVLKYRHAQSKAAERGLSLDDFLWESPNHHETRIVCTPSSQTDSPLRALRLDIHIIDVILHARDPTFFITIDLALAPITCSPSHSISFSTCTLRLDVPYAELANATIPNFSSQILSLSTDSRSAERVIATNGPTQTINLNVVQVMAPVAGDVFAGPISGGNNGGRNNTNNSKF
ncbi:hypothetical protein CCMSSC00406_0009815 [Pleurotus cornucopiae]|uniref:Uncharacterized protein n=1 Tax=Pleurotus cornucopiae TaxID=5321 RepID=A0ACB7IJZ0_PLECO|nr:hypothetical protein CCMSSC00406_0009815 [Pleurotus cornucopiae]